MLNFLNEMAASFAERQAFEADPEGYLARYQDLTDYERKLILSRDSSAVDGYVKNRLLNGDETIIPVHAATTVMVVAVLIGVAAAPDADDETVQLARYNDFWSHVASRGLAYTN